MAPPENAIVICVDEKPSIQALERVGVSEAPERPNADRPQPRLQAQRHFDAVCHQGNAGLWSQQTTINSRLRRL
jgi:hypothetical protein